MVSRLPSPWAVWAVCFNLDTIWKEDKFRDRIFHLIGGSMHFTRFSRYCLFGLALIQAESLSAAQNTFSLDVMRRITSISSVAPSPDGKTIAVVVTRPNYADNINESELYAVEVATGKTRQLTFGRKSVS